MPANARKSSDARLKTLSQLRGSPSLRPRDASASPQLRPVPEHESEAREYLRSSLKEKDPAPHSRATLRVDAFLGEWLSPDYFEMITPPPESTLMVTAAKAELLRPADKIETYTPSSPVVSGGNLWGTPQVGRQHSSSVSNVPSPLAHETNGPLENWQVFSRDVPSRDRTNSLGTSKQSEHFRPADSSNLSQKHDNTSGYSPPTPTYAISPGDPIPRGYVAHARDQCVNVDYKWDSMREPQCWGDGGRFGEEWSQMHKRFRHGLSSMVDWYATTRSESKQPTHHHHEVAPEEDDDEELVVVLITHGAGCNALIGALTNQPVLLDFGMASLTMAVRKDATSTSPSAGEQGSPSDSPAPGNSPALHPADAVSRPLPRRQSSIDAGLSSHYEMKIIASSEHLRPGVDPTKTSTPVVSSPILSASQTVPQSRSRRFGSASSHASAGAPVDANWNLPEPRARINSSLGSMRRPSRPVITPVVSSPALPSAVRNDSPTGLWGSASAKDVDSPNFLNTLARSNSLAARLSTPKTTTPERSVSPRADSRFTPTGPDSEAGALREEAESSVSALPTVDETPPPKLARSLSQKGLWGSAPNGAFPREAGIPKRRWTVVQD